MIVEFRVDSPILQEALTHAPETTVRYEEQNQDHDGIKLLFWAEGDDLTAFEDNLTADPTVRNLARLAVTESRRLYRVTFSEYGESVATFLSWVGLDISVLDSKGTHEGWTVRMLMPDRDTLHQYLEICEGKDLDFRLAAIYEESEGTKVKAELTNKQRETLLTARQLGYFQIPQQASLADVADQCGVSPQSASERLSRGTATLIDTAL